MGYRSEAVLAVSKEVRMKWLLLETQPELFQYCDSITQEGENIYYRWSQIKWYESFNDIIEIEDLMNDLTDEEFGFVRVGEEDNDIESKGYPWDFHIEVIREIEIPHGKSIK